MHLIQYIWHRPDIRSVIRIRLLIWLMARAPIANNPPPPLSPTLSCNASDCRVNAIVALSAFQPRAMDMDIYKTIDSGSRCIAFSSLSFCSVRSVHNNLMILAETYPAASSFSHVMVLLLSSESIVVHKR